MNNKLVKEVCTYILEAIKRGEGYEEAYNVALEEVEYWKSRALKSDALLAKDVWIYMGNGEDNLDSISDSVNIVINAAQLRNLIKQKEYCTFNKCIGVGGKATRISVGQYSPSICPVCKKSIYYEE